MIYNVMLAHGASYLSSERLHLEADSNRCRDPQRNTGWNLGTPLEAFGEGLRALKETELTGGLTQSTNLHPLDSQRLTNQPKSKYKLDLNPLLHTGRRCAAGAVSKAVAYLWIMLHYSQAALSGFSVIGCT